MPSGIDTLFEIVSEKKSYAYAAPPISLETEEFIEKIKAGEWLMKSIDQRQKTIKKVTQSILKHQGLN